MSEHPNLRVGDVVRLTHTTATGRVMDLGLAKVSSLRPLMGRRRRTDGRGWLKAETRLGGLGLSIEEDPD